MGDERWERKKRAAGHKTGTGTLHIKCVELTKNVRRLKEGNAHRFW
jgi:hypothetical protein